MGSGQMTYRRRERIALAGFPGSPQICSDPVGKLYAISDNFARTNSPSSPAAPQATTSSESRETKLFQYLHFTCYSAASRSPINIQL